VNLTLIRRDIVEKLGLKIVKMKTLQPVVGYFGREVSEKLQYWTLFILSSIDNILWRSNIINTLVTNCLAHQILLGLTFLHDNKLIVDADAGIVVDKHNEYDFITLDGQETFTTTLVKKGIQTNHISEPSCLATIPIREHIVAVEHLAKPVEPINT